MGAKAANIEKGIHNYPYSLNETVSTIGLQDIRKARFLRCATALHYRGLSADAMGRLAAPDREARFQVHRRLGPLPTQAS